MKKFLLYLALLPGLSFGQIKNFDDEANYQSSLENLTQYCFTPVYGPESNDGGTRQHLELDPTTMRLAYYKTPYNSEENAKKTAEIQWLAKYEIPVYEIDALVVDAKKNTVTIKMKDKKPSIQSYTIVSGTEYGPATKEYELVIQSDKLLQMRNLEKQINNDIKGLQAFHSKKIKLVDYLNQKLQEEVQYQEKDPQNYPEENKFKVVQPFKLDSGGRWLSVVVEKQDYNARQIQETQTVLLKSVFAITKDINVLFECDDTVTVTTRFLNTNQEETAQTSLFFLHLCYEKNNQKVGGKITGLFKEIGLEIENENWYD